MSTLLAYHWSPTNRRGSILAHGLVPGHPRTARDEDWNCPWISYADSPSAAWAMSGQALPRIESWDLWAAHLDPITTSVVGGEIRTEGVIPPGDLWYVGSRITLTDTERVALRAIAPCDHRATAEQPEATQCQNCPPRICADCGRADSIDQPCACWVSLKGMPAPDLKGVFARAGLSVTAIECAP